MGDKRISASSRWVAALSYVGIGLLLFIVSHQKSDFNRFHAKQGLLLLLGILIVHVFSVLLFFIKLVWIILAGGLLFLSFVGILNSFQGKKKYIPVIGKFVEQVEL